MEKIWEVQVSLTEPSRSAPERSSRFTLSTEGTPSGAVILANSNLSLTRITLGMVLRTDTGPNVRGERSVRRLFQYLAQRS